MKGILVAICLFCAHSVFGREIALGTDEHLMAGGEAEELRGPFTLDEARVSTSWKDLNGKAPNYGFTREVIWLRLQIHSDEQTERILYLDGWADHLDIYTVHDGVTVYHDAGLKARLTEEGKRFRRIFLPLVFDRGTTQIFFRMESSDTMRFPLEIFTRAHFERFRDTSIALISLYFGGMIVMAIYNLFLFAVTRDKSYSIYVLFVTSSLLYFAAQSGFILQFFPFVGEVALKRLNLIGSSLVALTMTSFASIFLGLKIGFPRMALIMNVIRVASAALLVCSFFPAVPYGVCAVLISYVALAGLAMGVISGLVVWKSGYSPARYYLLAFTTLVAGAVVFILGIQGVIGHNILTAHSMQIGSAAEVTLFAIALSDRISLLNRTVDRQMKELESAHALLANSEKKYRTIVEDTTDVIFSLDAEGRIGTINQAARKMLGYWPSMLEGTLFESLIFQRDGISLELGIALFRQSLLTLGEEPFQLRLPLRSRSGEPVDFQVRVEKIGEGSHAFILGKASAAGEDVLLHFLEIERGSYIIDNYLSTSELLSHRITRNLTRFFDDQAVADIQLVLREMLLNAIEHGNLEVDFDAKTAAQRDGDYLKFLQERQNRSEFRGRRVRVDFGLNQDRVWYRIADEGKGFDHANALRQAQKNLRDTQSTHGRGIGIASRLFDIMQYNAKGNQVFLVKNVHSRRM